MGDMECQEKSKLNTTTARNVQESECYWYCCLYFELKKYKVLYHTVNNNQQSLHNHLYHPLIIQQFYRCSRHQHQLHIVWSQPTHRRKQRSGMSLGWFTWQFPYSVSWHKIHDLLPNKKDKKDRKEKQDKCSTSSTSLTLTTASILPPNRAPKACLHNHKYNCILIDAQIRLVLAILSFDA